MLVLAVFAALSGVVVRVGERENGSASCARGTGDERARGQDMTENDRASDERLSEESKRRKRRETRETRDQETRGRKCVRERGSDPEKRTGRCEGRGEEVRDEQERGA